MLRVLVCVAALAVPAMARAAVPSLTLTPPSVKRGHTVLIKGSADGCAAGSTMLLTRPSMRRPLAVLTFPLASATVLLGDHSAPCAVIFVKDPDATEMPSSDVLMRQFGLTRREAELALAVTQGGGLGAAAREIGVSISTARTHLQRVFEKTNPRRQAELIRLILRV